MLKEALTEEEEPITQTEEIEDQEEVSEEISEEISEEDIEEITEEEMIESKETIMKTKNEDH
jgi:hypothetical protein